MCARSDGSVHKEDVKVQKTILALVTAGCFTVPNYGNELQFTEQYCQEIKQLLNQIAKEYTDKLFSPSLQSLSKDEFLTRLEMENSLRWLLNASEASQHLRSVQLASSSYLANTSISMKNSYSEEKLLKNAA